MSKYINAGDFCATMYHKSFEEDNGMQKWDNGEWVELPNGWDGIDEYLRFKCSKCHREVFNNFPSCPYRSILC